MVMPSPTPSSAVVAILLALVAPCSASEAAAPARPAAPAHPARAAAGGAGGDSGFAWTLGAHVGVPVGPPVSVSAIVGHATRFGAAGLLLMAEPGLGGGKLAI